MTAVGDDGRLDSPEIDTIPQGIATQDVSIARNPQGIVTRNRAYRFTYRRRSTPKMIPVAMKFTMVNEPP